MTCSFKPEICKISREIVKRNTSSNSSPSKKSEGANLTDDEVVSNKANPNQFELFYNRIQKWQNHKDVHHAEGKA